MATVEDCVLQIVIMLYFSKGKLTYSFDEDVHKLSSLILMKSHRIASTYFEENQCFP